MSADTFFTPPFLLQPPRKTIRPWEKGREEGREEKKEKSLAEFVFWRNGSIIFGGREAGGSGSLEFAPLPFPSAAYMETEALQQPLLLLLLFLPWVNLLGKYGNFSVPTLLPSTPIFWSKKPSYFARKILLPA